MPTHTPGFSQDFKGLADPKTAKARARSSAGLVRWYCGFVGYLSGFGKASTEGRSGEPGWKVITSSDSAQQAKKLSEEIANG